MLLAMYENVVWDNDTAQTYHDGDELAAPFAMDEGDMDSWGCFLYGYWL